MKSILTVLKNIKNLFPYFILISIYFFFINIEAKKDKDNNLEIREKRQITEDSAKDNFKQKRILIPVIPYGE